MVEMPSIIAVQIQGSDDYNRVINKALAKGHQAIVIASLVLVFSDKTKAIEALLSAAQRSAREDGEPSTCVSLLLDSSDRKCVGFKFNTPDMVILYGVTEDEVLAHAATLPREDVDIVANRGTLQ